MNDLNASLEEYPNGYDAGRAAGFGNVWPNEIFLYFVSAVIGGIKLKAIQGFEFDFDISLELQGIVGSWWKFALYRVPFYYSCLGECCKVKLQKCYMDDKLHPTFHQHRGEQMNDWNLILGELFL